MTDQPKIIPTVGRVVFYYPSDDDIHYARIDGVKGQPLAALVAWVNDDSDRTLNLGVPDRYGRSHDRQRVLLVQPGEDPPRTKTNAYCTWMPYQVGQAAKTEALEKIVQRQTIADKPSA